MSETSFIASLPGPLAAAWPNVERGAVDDVRSSLSSREDGAASEAEAVLLATLALQNAGRHEEAFHEAERALGAASPLDIWARAERTYAARAQALLKPGDNADVTETDAAAALASGSPWSKLIAARVLLTTGLKSLQDKLLDDGRKAEHDLNEALALMEGVGSHAGEAVIRLELGKLNAWQGRAEEAFRHYLSGLAIWRWLNEANATALWHELGSALLDSRHYAEAAAILNSTFEINKATRTQNALTRALIGLGDLDKAQQQAEAVLAGEQAARAGDPRRDPYRELMAQRDLVEIALKKRSAALMRRAEIEAGATDLGQETIEPSARHEADMAEDLLEAAETRFNEAVRLRGDPRTQGSSLFSVWMGGLDKATRSGGEAKVGFAEMRLLQLELLITGVHSPAEASRNLAKVADVYGQQGDRMQELEAREQAADAAEADRDFPRAVQQLELGMRTAELCGLGAVARHFRQRLEAASARIRRADLAAPGYLIRGVERRQGAETVIAATSVETGQRVRIHRFETREGKADPNLRKGLAALGNVFSVGRVASGLPALVGPLPDPNQMAAAIDIVVEAAEGEPLSEAMRASVGDWRRATRVIRDLSFTIGVMHQAGFQECRPDPYRVVLDLGDNPVDLDILPLVESRAGGAVEDVRALARLLYEWITGDFGEKPKTRALALGGKSMRRLFKPEKDGPDAGLDELLSGILLHGARDVPSPRVFADRLQAFCRRPDQF